MRVRDAMTKPVLTVGPDHTLRQVAKRMAERRVGSVIVFDPDSEGIGILTERDMLNAIAAGLDPDAERVGAHLTREVVYAGPDWTLTEAADAMARGGFRHLVVMDGADVLGVISVRDIMRAWVRIHREQQRHADATA
ncbi:MAG TPA: CBS domain-containing protein [Natronosporangium sp.]